MFLVRFLLNYFFYFGNHRGFGGEANAKCITTLLESIGLFPSAMEKLNKLITEKNTKIKA